MLYAFLFTGKLNEFDYIVYWGRIAASSLQPALFLHFALAFSRDGRMLLTAGADGAVRFWDVGTWQEANRFDWGIGKIHLVAFAPDGLTCAATGENGQVVVWDVDT